MKDGVETGSPGDASVHPLEGSWTRATSAGDLVREEMFELLDRCFVGVTREVFLRDLASKDGVVLLRQGARLAGFSTFTLAGERDPSGREVSVLCSGDTIVDPRHWGSSALGRTLLGAALDLHRTSGREALWWYLITSGPRTWGVLPTFFREFHPNPSGSTGADIADWIRRLGETRWPGRLDARGIVHLDSPQRLRPPLDALPTTRLDDPGVAWYASTNPGWREGDEFPSLVRVDLENLTRAGRRYIGGRFEGRS